MMHSTSHFQTSEVFFQPRLLSSWQRRETSSIASVVSKQRATVHASLSLFIFLSLSLSRARSNLARCAHACNVADVITSKVSCSFDHDRYMLNLRVCQDYDTGELMICPREKEAGTL